MFRKTRNTRSTGLSDIQIIRWSDALAICVFWSARNASRSEAGGSARRRLLARNDGLLINILGPKNAQDRSGLVAFTLSANSKEIHGHDVAQVLDSQGIAVRSGHHCVMPLHAKLGLAATTRVSFGIYNTKEDINRFIKALNLIPKIFG